MVGLPLFNELSFIFEFPFARKHTQLHTQENKKKNKAEKQSACSQAGMSGFGEVRYSELELFGKRYH